MIRRQIYANLAQCTFFGRFDIHVMRLVTHFWPLVAAAILIYTFSRPWGAVPPPGKFFSPFHGFLQNTVSDTSARQAELSLNGLQGDVTIWYDDNAVPHIFAGNDADLYFAQGYAVARDRLWQMEFYTLVAAGRLTEIVGRDALNLDRYHRRLGMARTASAITKRLLADSVAGPMLEAYAAGVNAYIRQLTYQDLPIEYKLLGYAPEPWSPYKSILMLMNMRLTLNSGSTDHRLTNVFAKYGRGIIQSLFPDYPSAESPIVPEGTPWTFTPVPIPSVPTTIAALPNGTPTDDLAFHWRVPLPQSDVGSNNWAIAGERSATGLPILANDPHLELTLPSIWYQIQLSAPGVNVYGVTLPGTPSVIIGFNEAVAWGVTNVGSDVMDFYRIQFGDSGYDTYWHDGQWKPTTRHLEVYRLKGGDTWTDTVYCTHHGPVEFHESRGGDDATGSRLEGYAMRWIGNDTTGADVLTFHYLNRAKNYDDYRSALTHFTAPAQNFVFASRDNDIAITSNGKLPVKWKGQGKFVLDGTLAGHDWQGWIPYDQLPTVRNPERGYVSSANQFPADTTYPYYLNWSFAHPSRAMRINERLDRMQQATADSLRALQNDNYHVDARRILPRLLKAVQADDSLRWSPAYQAIAAWNLENQPDAVGASLFDYWRAELLSLIWSDDFPSGEALLYPTADRTMALLLDEPLAPWFDRKDTPDTVETADDIIRLAFRQAVAKLHNRFGPLSPKNWAWGNVKETQVMHLIPAFRSFGRTGIRVGGGSGIVNATSETNGPSWRMVVQLDREWPVAFGLYPGGQSGNPASSYYDNMIDRWASGQLDTLLFMRHVAEPSARLRHRLLLKPAPAP